MYILVYRLRFIGNLAILLNFIAALQEVKKGWQKILIQVEREAMDLMQRRSKSTAT